MKFDLTDVGVVSDAELLEILFDQYEDKEQDLMPLGMTLAVLAMTAMMVRWNECEWDSELFESTVSRMEVNVKEQLALNAADYQEWVNGEAGRVVDGTA